MSIAIRGICSMATSGLLQELATAHARHTGVQVGVEAVGGVEAARRVSAGEAFDWVALASDAIDALGAAGHVEAAGKVDLVRSGVGVAVAAGAARPDLSGDDALREAVLRAASVAYSTGPSGVALVAMFRRWGIEAQLQGRLVQAPPGVPVGLLVARGDVALGFQQMSELLGVDGIDIVGPLPAESRITTVFSAASCSGSAKAGAVRAWLAFASSAASADAKRRHGMEPA